MATWHQSRNPGGLRALWAPHPTSWKVVCDKPGEFASSIAFRTKREAERNARRSGGALVPPTRYRSRKES